MAGDDKSEDVNVERDHPQTRKGESDARGSAEWRDDVVPQDEKKDGKERASGRTVNELAHEADETRRKAVSETASHAFGSNRKAASE